MSIFCPLIANSTVVQDGIIRACSERETGVFAIDHDGEELWFTKHVRRQMAKRRISEKTIRAVITGEQGTLDRYDGCSQYYGWGLDTQYDRCIKMVVDNLQMPRHVMTAYEVPRRS